MTSHREEEFAQYTEAFSFLNHEREDVRKLSVQGIAQQSKENPSLTAYFVHCPDGGKSVDLLLQYLHAGGTALLGDILTILINVVADDAPCAEVFVKHRVVPKCMRLLDGLSHSSQSDAYVRSVEEMTLMLLNNLTATHISAVDDLLQNEDEDMRGFYLSKLQTLFERLGAKAANDSDDDEEEEKKKKKVPTAPTRDIRRWILQILLNLTRSKDGQQQLLEDEDWCQTLEECLQSPNARHRWIAAQCYRNCATATLNPFVPLLLKSNAVRVCMERLSRDGNIEPDASIQVCLAEVLCGILASEEGIAYLESINARQLLEKAVTASMFYHHNTDRNDTVHGSADRVEVVSEKESENNKSEKDNISNSNHTTLVKDGSVVILARDTCEFIEKYILPYLDEIVNAYVAPGSDELD